MKIQEALGGFRLHRFVVVARARPGDTRGGSRAVPTELWFNDVHDAFRARPADGAVFVTLEETGSRYEVRRP